MSIAYTTFHDQFNMYNTIDYIRLGYVRQEDYIGIKDDQSDGNDED